MNGKQQTVIWMGLSLIFVRLITTSQGKILWQVITGGSGGGNTSLGPSGEIGRMIPKNQGGGAIGAPLSTSGSQSMPNGYVGV